MADFDWDGTTGDWNTATLWAEDAVPNAITADVTIAVAGTYTVNIANETFTADSVTLDNAAAALDIGYNSSALTLGGVADTMLLQAGTLDLNGILAGGTLDLTGGTVDYGDGTLYGMTVVGGITLAPDQELNIQGGFSLVGSLAGQPGTIDLNNSYEQLSFRDNETLANDVLLVGDTAASAFMELYLANTLTVGAASTFDVAGDGNYLDIYEDEVLVGSNYVAQAALLNQGVFELTGTGDVVQADIGGFINTGLVSVGSLETLNLQLGYNIGTPAGSFANTGTISIAQGGTLTTNATLSAASLGTVDNSGLLILSGLYDNTGQVLAIGTTGAFTDTVLEGTLRGGTIDPDGGKLTFASGTLDGVTWGASNFLVPAGQTLTITDGLTFSSPNETIDVAGALIFKSGETLTGASVVVSGTDAVFGASGTGALTIGANTDLLTEGTVALIGSVVNYGTVEDAGGPLNFNLSGSAGQGTLEVDAGATLLASGAFGQTAFGDLINQGTLDIAGTLLNAGSLLDIATGTNFATLQVGGTIAGGTVRVDGGSLELLSGAVFSGVTYDSPLALAGSDSFSIENGALFTGQAGSGPGSLAVTGTQDSFDVLDSERLDNIAVVLGSAPAVRYGGGGDTLNISTTLTLGASGLIETVGPQTISTIGNVTGFIEGGTLINQGTLAAFGTQTTLIVDDKLLNTGTLLIGAGATLGVYAAGTLAPLLGTVVNQGGVLQISGNISNTGSVIDIAAGSALADVDFANVQITGGTVSYDGGTAVFTDSSSASQVTFEGTVDLSAPDAGLYSTGITLLGTGGVGPGALELTGAGGYFSLYNDSFSPTNETLDNATIFIGNAGGSSDGIGIRYANTLIFGPNLVVDNIGAGGTSDIAGQGTLINQGTIIAASTGGLLELGSPYGSFLNLGTIAIEAGATVEVVMPATLAALGDIVSQGGVLLLDGSYNNTGTIALAGALQDIQLLGTIKGGTIDETGGTLTFDRGTLDGVAAIGSLDLANPSAFLTVRDGISLLGGLGTVEFTGADATLAVADNETLSNLLIDIGGSQTGSIAVFDELLAESTLTLAANVTLDSTIPNAVVDLRVLDYGGGTLINDGTIIAGASGDVLTIQPLDLFYLPPDIFINNGLLEIAAGATLEIAENASIAALGSIVDQGGVLELTGTYTNSGVVDVAATGAFSDLLLNGTLVGGTLFADGGTLAFGDAVLSGATLIDDSIALGGHQLVLEAGSTLIAPSGQATITYGGYGGVLGLDSAETLNNATLLIGGTYAYGFLGVESGNATLGAGTTIELQGSGDYLNFEGLTDATPGLTNEGLIQIGSGAALALEFSNFTNAGLISLANGGEIQVNYGVAVNLAQLGSLEGADGRLYVIGGLDLAGETLTLSPSSSFGELDVLGAVHGGTIDVLAGGTLDMFNTSTLDGVTVEGLLQETLQSGFFNIADGITLLGTGGVGPGTLAVTGPGSEVELLGNQTLDNAVVVLSGSAAAFGNIEDYVQFAGLVTTGSLVLGPNLLVEATIGGIGGPGTIVNEGTIAVSAGSELYVTPYGQYSGSPLFTNLGTMLIGSSGTLVLAADITTASIGSVVESGGTLDLTSSLDNTGTSITVGAGGSLQNLVFGEIAEGLTYTEGDFVTGGSVVDDGGNVGFLGYNVFSGVTYDGGLTIANGAFLELVGTSAVEGLGGAPETIDLDGGGLGVGVSASVLDAMITLGGSGAILELDAAFTGSTILFAGTAGMLELDAPGSFADPIIGFGAGNTVDFFSSASLTTLTYDGTDLVALAGTTAVATLDIGPRYIAADFTFTTDGYGDFFISTTQNAPCYAAGTRIATAEGEVPVEALRVGDLVRLASGEMSAVRWVGQRRVDCRRHPRPELVRPVRIIRDAFGRGLPKRDLVVSPDHALFIGGVLIPARQLLNGASVRQEKVVSVHYFHVELDAHDILLAEGLPAESYLDTGNRRQFANGGALVALHADYAAEEDRPGACAALVLAGPEVKLARRRLLGRLPGLGYGLTATRGVSIGIGARVLSPVQVVGEIYRFVLPSGARRCRILSASGVPAALDVHEADTRRLGACVTGLVFGGRMIPLGSSRLGDGFWPMEGSWRWTDGAAELSLPEARGNTVFEVRIRQVIQGWEGQGPAPGPRQGQCPWTANS